jgi:hypothetical protein
LKHFSLSFVVLPHLDGSLGPLVVEGRRDVLRELTEDVAEVVEPISGMKQLILIGKKIDFLN